MNNSYRESPSDMPYRAMKWIDVWSRIWGAIASRVTRFFGWWNIDRISNAICAAAVVIILLGIAYASLAYVRLVQEGCRESELQLKCKVQCNVDGHHELVENKCYCLPEDGPAYRPEELP